jgi:type IV pilus assembly protein PilW
MNMRRATALHHARGFTLVELMVTVSIALFLVGGLLTIVQNMRVTYNNQQALVQLQDEQRFAMTVITDAVQAAGYFADPTTQQVDATSFPGIAPFAAGLVFFGTHAAGVADTVAQDTLWTRFQAKPGYGPILCNGTDSSTQPAQRWTIQFSLNVQQQLVCTATGTLNGTQTVPLVSGVSAFAVYYGVKRNIANTDYNIDTYETWDVLQQNLAVEGANIGAVRIVITFLNPLAGQPSQPATVTLERVIEVMSRGGPNT